MTTTRAFASAEHWEHRPERSPADQATGGLLHPNGTQLVSADHDFMAACTRWITDQYRQVAA